MVCKTTESKYRDIVLLFGLDILYNKLMVITVLYKIKFYS